MNTINMPSCETNTISFDASVWSRRWIVFINRLPNVIRYDARWTLYELAKSKLTLARNFQNANVYTHAHTHSAIIYQKHTHTHTFCTPYRIIWIAIEETIRTHVLWQHNIEHSRGISAKLGSAKPNKSEPNVASTAGVAVSSHIYAKLKATYRYYLNNFIYTMECSDDFQRCTVQSVLKN